MEGNPHESLRVVLIEDVVYHSLRPRLEEAGIRGTHYLPLEAADPERVIGLEPQVVLMDLRLAGSSGLYLVHLLRRALPETPILLLAAEPDDLEIVEALRAGADGLLERGADAEALADSLRRIQRGDKVVGDRIVAAQEARRWVEGVLQRSGVPRSRIPARLRPLTPRDIDLLKGLASGYSNEDIAQQLGLSPHTVKNEIYNLYRKLGVSDRTRAALYAIRFGWTDLRQTQFV